MTKTKNESRRHHHHERHKTLVGEPEPEDHRRSHRPSPQLHSHHTHQQRSSKEQPSRRNSSNPAAHQHRSSNQSPTNLYSTPGDPQNELRLSNPQTQRGSQSGNTQNRLDSQLGNTQSQRDSQLSNPAFFNSQTQGRNNSTKPPQPSTPQGYPQKLSNNSSIYSHVQSSPQPTENPYGQLYYPPPYQPVYGASYPTAPGQAVLYNSHYPNVDASSFHRISTLSMNDSTVRDQNGPEFQTAQAMVPVDEGLKKDKSCCCVVL